MSIRQIETRGYVDLEAQVEMNSKQNSGQITVFLSLVLVLILSLIFTIIEVTRVNTSKAMISNILDMGLDSVLAEYNKELFETYDLLFIDGAYGSPNFSKNNIQDHLQEYMSYNYNPCKGNEFIRNTNLWKIRENGISILNVERASDYKGEVLRNQAVSYIKNKVGLDRLVEVRDLLGTNSTRNYENDSFEREWNSNRATFNREKDKIENQEIKSNVNISLIDSIERMKNKSVLGLVVEDLYSLSNKRIEQKSIPSTRSLPIEEMELVLEEDVSESLAEIMYDEYILEKFGSYLYDNESEVLDYQVEYILMGEDTDVGNLEGVINKILLIREGINFSYLLVDNEKRREAYEMAVILVGFTGLQPLIIATQISLLLAWAYGESIMDIRALLSGEKVPFLKNKESWELQLGNLGNLKTYKRSEQKEDKKGFSYEDYLRILLFINNRSDKSLRVMDMIELSLNSKMGNENLKIENLISRLNVYSSWKVDSLFLSFPFLRDINYADGEYLFEIEMEDAY